MDDNIKNSEAYLNSFLTEGNGFSVSKNYFDNLEDAIEIKVFENSFPKQQVFTTPHSYFKSLDNNILTKVSTTKKETKVISFKERVLKIIPVSVAASLILFIGLNSFVFNTDKKLTLDSLSRQLHERVTDLAFSTEPLKSEEVNSDVLLERKLALYRVGTKTDTIDAVDFVAIDWGSKVRDWLLTAYPQLRDAKLRTNSLSLAINNLQSEGGVAVLPIGVEAQFSEGTALTLIETIDDLSLSVFVHTMKQVRRVGLTEIIESVTQDC